MDNCIFCKIIAGGIPATKVYEDEHATAFLDIRPVNPGHTLVVPREHHRNIFDIPSQTLSNVMPAVKKIAEALRASGLAEGVNIHINNEPVAGQVIFHSHLHVIPRIATDNHKLWHGREMAPGEADLVAQKIKSALGGK